MFQKTTLNNGLRVVTAPMPAAKSVAVMVMVAAGSRYETKPTNGIAHFAEHMFFKGTERRPTAKDISAEVDGIGGEFNAFTSKEYTGYYIKCAAEHRSLALDVLADQILHSKFDAEELEREKGVIIEELNMYVDTPRDHVDSVYDHLLFGDQPLGWDIIGTKETIRAAGRQTFLDYLGAWYAPRRMVVGAAGAVNGDFARRGRAPVRPARTTARPGAPAPIAGRAGRGPGKLETRDSDQAHLRLGVRGLPTAHRRPLRRCRCCGRSSAAACRRGSSSRCASGWAWPTTSSATTQSYDDAGTLFSQAGVDIERIDLAVKTIVGEFAKLARGAGRGGRAAPDEELPQGAPGAPARGPARPARLRPAPRGAGGPPLGARGGARGDRGRHRRRHPAAGGRGDPRRRAQLRSRRAVRRRRSASST